MTTYCKSVENVRKILFLGGTHLKKKKKLGLKWLKMTFFAEAQARIHDTKGGDIMVKRGSTIELNCTVESGDRAHHSLAVFWYLEDRVIDWMGQTGHGRGVQVSQQERLPIVTSI